MMLWGIIVEQRSMVTNSLRRFATVNIGIIGSRSLYDVPFVDTLINAIIHTHYPYDNPITIITGREVYDKKGLSVDTMVSRIVEARWLISSDPYAQIGLANHVVHSPENERWEPDGYKDRNIKIARDVDILYGIISKRPAVLGADWTLNYAENTMGAKVIRLEVSI